VHKKPEQSPVVEPPVVPPSVVQPIIDDFKRTHKIEPPPAPPVEQGPPVGPLTPPKSAELDQDRGGGYNANHVIPQP
jgi:hypothetical protein